MGMGKADLYDLSFREYNNKCEGYFQGYKAQCERERLWVTMMLQPHSKKGLKPEKLITFAWERKIGLVNKKESKESLKRILKRDGR